MLKKPVINFPNEDFYNLLKYNEAILTKLPFSIFISDANMNVRFINDFAKDHFSIDQFTHLNTNLVTFFGRGNENISALIEKCISEKKEEIYYDVQVSSNSGVSSHNISILPLFDGKQFIGNIITMNDVTDYENMRKQLALKENLSSIGLLSAGVAHEINNPLEIINYYMQNLKLTNSDNQDIQEIVHDVQEEIVSISNIIDNLLLFSEDKHLDSHTIDVNNLIEGIVSLLSKASGKFNVKIVFSSSNDSILIDAVRTELKQVFLNILKNSLDVLEQDGLIEVYTTIINSQSDRPYVEILFKDNGPGIDNEIKDSIFIPFYSTKKGNSSNMGLGLSISYRIVNKYGGTMTMRNHSEGGCETLLTFPLVMT